MEGSTFFFGVIEMVAAIELLNAKAASQQYSEADTVSSDESPSVESRTLETTSVESDK